MPVDYGHPTCNRLRVTDLRNLAKNAGLSGYSKLRKRDLCALLLKKGLLTTIDNKPSVPTATESPKSPEPKYAKESYVRLTSELLKELAGLSLTTEYNGEPVILQSSWNPERSELTYGFDFVDKKAQKAFLKSCRTRFHDFHMVEQIWTIKNGNLYLENQENMSTSYKCMGTDKARRVFRGAARKLWCVFLVNGLEKQILNLDTVIDLEARGSLANIEDIKEGQKKLEEFYERLGFKRTGKLSDTTEHPMFQATVKDILDNVCGSLGKEEAASLLNIT